MAVTVIFKGDAKEAFLREVIKEYSDLLPHEWRVCLSEARRRHHDLIRSNGFSDQKHFMHKMVMPKNFYSFVKQQAWKRLGEEDFWKQRKNYDLLCRLATDLKTKTKPRVRFDTGATKK